MAQALAGVCAALDGVDLSPRMLERAARTRLYRRLHEGDLVSFLEGEGEAAADLVAAADVFVYMAVLDAVFREARRVLIPGGLFAFTVQAHDGDGVVLGEDKRYAHGEAYLRGLAAANAFAVALCEGVATRRDGGRDVPGFLLVLER
jgi:predicted TPR repeat methyltransferase